MKIKKSNSILAAIIIVLQIVPFNLFSTVHAEEANPVSTENAVEITKDNFLDYFNINGSANYVSETGILTLTPDEGYKVGNATLKAQLDLSRDFSIEGELNIGNKSQVDGGADGVGFGFHPQSINTVGAAGATLGIGNIPDAFGWKADTYYNEREEVQAPDGTWLRSTGDPSRYKDKAFGAYMYNAPDNEGKIWTHTYDGAEAPAQQISEPVNNEFKPISIKYNGETKIFTIAYDGKEWTTPVGTFLKGNFYSFLISGSTGGNKNLQQFKVNKFKFQAAPGELDASKISDKSDVKTGDIVTYTIDVQNTKADTLLKDVVVEDQLPEGLELVANSLTVAGNITTNEAIAKNSIKTTIDNIKGLEVIPVSFKAKVIKADDGKIKNIATVTDSNNPNNPKKPEREINVTAPGELLTNKSVNKDEVNPGDKITYTIEARNIKPGTVLKNIKIEDQLPEGLELITDSIKLNDQVVINEAEGNMISITVPEIKGNETSKVTFDAIVTQKVEGRIKNIATITDPSDPNNPKRPEKEINIAVPGDLEAEKIADKTKAKKGEHVKYTIKVKNIKANSTVKNAVVVQDHLPEGIKLDPAGKVQLNGQTVRNESKTDGEVLVTIPELRGGETAEVTFDTVITKTTNGKITNIATVTDPSDPNNPKKPEKEINVVDSPGELRADKKANREEVKKGDTVTYTIEATNIKEGTIVKGATIEDKLPEGIQLVTETVKLNNKEVKNEGKGNEIKVSLPNLRGNEKAVVTFDVIVTQEENKKITNIATVTDPSDPNNPKKPEKEINVVDSPGELRADKKANREEVKKGDTVTYTIEATNIKEGTIVKGATIEDKLPEGIQLVTETVKLNNKEVKNEGKGNEIKVSLPNLRGNEKAVVTFDVIVTQEENKKITNIATVTNPSDPNNPKKPEKVISVSNIKTLKIPKTPNQENSHGTTGFLPRTGEEKSQWLFTAGLIILVGLTGLSALRYKKNK